MATATQTPNRELNQNPKRSMIEITAPELFQFSDTHRTIEGVLISIDPVDVKGKETIQYTLRHDARRRSTFLATADLVKKITPDQIGHYMQIRYEGENKEIKTQGSPMRMFKVMVSEEKEAGY